jgi:hypothetical protein
MERPFRRHYRLQSSVVLLVLQVAATALHVIPSLVYPPVSVRTTTRVVVAIQHLGPVWVLLFGCSSLALGAALWFGRPGRGEAYGHLFCAGVWVFYATGLWWGAFAEQPHGTVLFPVLATCVVGFHTIVAASYNEDAAELDRGHA